MADDANVPLPPQKPQALINQQAWGQDLSARDPGSPERLARLEMMRRYGLISDDIYKRYLQYFAPGQGQ